MNMLPNALRAHRTRILVIAAALAAFFGAAFVIVYLWLLADLPPVRSVETRTVRPTTQIVDRNGRLLYEVLDPDAGKQINLDPSVLPETCVQATLATEDSRFYHHPGVDPVSIGRALVQNWRAGGEIVSGASTLTQQLARTLLLEPAERYEQTVQRKLREAWLAWRLERIYTKDELLALYLNQTYYGNFAYGIESAAQIFFAKPAAQLSRGECTLLAGLIQYPGGYNPLQAPDVAKARQLTVLRLMREAGYVTQAESDAIAAQPLRYRSHLFDIEAPHFVMYVQDLLVQRLGAERLREGGLRVVTTLDLDLQREVEASVRYRLEQLNCRTPGVCDALTDPARRAENAAALVLDSHTGDVLAMVGSPDYFDEAIEGNVNGALILRQPGSAIKPFTYAAAMDPEWSAQRGQAPMTPATVIADLPATFYVTDYDELGNPISNVPYVPVNYDRSYHGPVSVRTALGSSYNIPAVKALDTIGVETLQQLASGAGISTFTEEYGLALTLGGGEVRLLDLVTAFGIFQNGQRLESRSIIEIGSMASATAEGAAPVLRYPVAGSRPAVIEPQTAYLITDILSDEGARIPAFGENSVLSLPFPAAVKTGTTTDWRDNWTVGYSTERIVGVWVGNADNTPMIGVSGVDGAGPIWRDVMLAAHDGEPAPFPRPDGIVERVICSPSGLLPTPECPRTRLERFITGTEPTREDDQFQSIAIDRATGMRATADTPPERTVERTYWMLPAQYHEWMLAQNIAIAPPVGAPRVAQIDAANPEGAPIAVADDASALVLTAPTSNTAFQIHPGMPESSQRIELAGYAADGGTWSELRLMKDGEPVSVLEEGTRLRIWWVLEPGVHHFWLEGRATPDADPVRSAAAMVVVTEYARQDAQAAQAVQDPAR